MAKATPRGKRGQITLPSEASGPGLTERAGFLLASATDAKRRPAAGASIRHPEVLPAFGDRENAHLAAAAIGALEDEKRIPTQEAGAGERPPMEIAPEAEIWPDRPGRELQGCIDQVGWTDIGGWVWDPNAPGERIRLEVMKGESKIVRGLAGDHRPDLAAFGIGDGGHGFKINLNGELSRNTRHVLEVRCADTGAIVPGSPIILDPAELPPPMETGTEPPALAHGRAALAEQAAFRFSLDEFSDREASGWIMMPSQPSHRCVVALKEGQQVLARAVASRFRSDLVSAGIGDGCHSFVLAMPRSLLDGDEHLIEIVEQDTGVPLTLDPIRWRSAAGGGQTAFDGIAERMGPARLFDVGRRPNQEPDSGTVSARTDRRDPQSSYAGPQRPSAALASKTRWRAAHHFGTRILFDISDLIYYIGEHANLTGIQRVQSSIVLAILANDILPQSHLIFLSFNAKTRNLVAIPSGFLISLLEDLFLPEQQRLVAFPAEEARYGLLPGAREFDGVGILDDGNASVLYLLGAAWVHQDYVHRVLAMKRKFGTKFVMTVHDLIPIYARETCDQDTARVFEEFMRRALRHVDHVLGVSENTARDIRRHMRSLQLPEPPITVTRNGSSFAEFLPDGGQTCDVTLRDLPERFVLFVATIEGRKNHQLMLQIWRRMIADGDDPPNLICVGRLGWKSSGFISALVETDYLSGRISLLRDISDADLTLLYSRCLFTVCPTFYEGWGLPVGESLAMGKICVSSDRASIPEVAGEFGVYIDIDNVEHSFQTIRKLISDQAYRKKLEAKIRRGYVPITWRSVAEKVVDACEVAAGVIWRDPYPYTSIPYSSEISFGRLDRDADGTGEALLTRIEGTRKGLFLSDALHEHSFLMGEEARSGGSWAQPEDWGTWACHSGGEIALGLPPNDSLLYYVFLRLRVNGLLHDHTVTVSANGEKIWEGNIGPRPRDIALRVRRRTVNSGGWRLRILAEAKLSAELRNQIAALDSRVPTIGFERLIVVPESDLKTRVDILYTLLL